MNWIATNILGSHALWTERKFWKKSPCQRAKFELPAGKLQVIHPDVLQWGFELVNRGSAQQNMQPSSGFLAILIAIHYCDSINLFGFSTPGKTNTGKYHYYDKLDSNQAKRDHSISTEQKLVEELVAAGAIGRFN